MHINPCCATRFPYLKNTSTTLDNCGLLCIDKYSINTYRRLIATTIILNECRIHIRRIYNNITVTYLQEQQYKKSDTT